MFLAQAKAGRGCSINAMGNRQRATRLTVRMIGSAELQVIQAALRVDDDRDAALISTLQRPLDWQQLLRLALRHGVLSLIFKRLKEVALDLVPPDVMRQLTAWQKAHELRVFQMTVDLIKVVRALEAEGISVLCLKGPVLGQVLYGDPAMREFLDIDILVRKKDYNRAEKVLLGIGFVLAHPDCEIDLNQDRHSIFIKGIIHLEVHVKLDPRDSMFVINTEECFARRRKVKVYGQSLFTLCQIDNLLYCCIHNAHHYWTRFCNIMDFYKSLQHIEQNEWVQFCLQVKALCLYRHLSIGYHLLNQLIMTADQKEIKNIFMNNLIQRWAIHNIQSYLLSETCRPDELDKFVFTLAITDGRIYKELINIISNPTENDRKWLKLPNQLQWIYYILRPFRLAGYGLSLLCLRSAR